MNYWMKRAKEPSTWASLGALLAIFGVQGAEAITGNLASVGAGLAGLAGIFLGEGKAG